MNLQYLNWKIYLDNPADVEPEEFFKAWNAWIPDSPEVFVDVADYQHVNDGPLVVLVGHYLNYSLDSADRKVGLLYDYKQPMEGTNEEKLKTSLVSLLKAAQRLEADAAFKHKPRFKAELRLIVNSRALAPNTAETLAAVKPDLAKVLGKAFGQNGYALQHLSDPRQRFAVQVTGKGASSVAELVKKLA